MDDLFWLNLELNAGHGTVLGGQDPRVNGTASVLRGSGAGRHLLAPSFLKGIMGAETG